MFYQRDLKFGFELRRHGFDGLRGVGGLERS
jgi:hypothetical protein